MVRKYSYTHTPNTTLKSVRVKKELLELIPDEYNFSKIVNRALAQFLEVELKEV